LFYEPKLSGDNSISCGFCHQQSAGFTHHGHSVSHGIFDQTGHRNSPPVMNLAWSRFFTWDGGVFDLDLFSIVPITNPIEMGEDIHRVLDKLKADPKYPPRFEKAFGSKEITSAKMYMALSQFMLMCVSANSKYDQWKTGKGASMTEEELSGYTLVQKKCGKCHSGELFTDGNFHNNGLGQGRLKEDLGRQAITLNLDDNRKFKVPSLRNLGYTAPYMHDGRFLTIDAVLNFYSGGVKDSPQLDSTLRHIGGVGIPLTNEEKQKIKVFLETLNEPAFKSKYELSEYAAFP
jgi:cytochrome c peroxidase